MERKFLFLFAFLGMVCLGTKADNVAKIGSTEYATLSAALSAATEGQTVTLCADIALTSSDGVITFPSTFSGTLDLNGNKIERLANNNYVLDIPSGADVTLVDNADTKGWIKGTPVAATNKVASLIRVKGKLTLDGAALVSDYCCVKVDEDPGAGEFVMNSGSCEIIPYSGETVYQPSFAVMNWAKATINGGAFNGNVQTLECKDNNVSKCGTTTINGGTFNPAKLYFYMYDTNYVPTVTVASGITGLTPVVQYGKAAIKTTTNTDGTVTYSAVAPVAQIGTTYYASLADAVTAATDGATIKMYANETLTASLGIQKNITLDLNGKTITTGAKNIQIYNGTLNVTGTGTITGSSNYLITVFGASTDQADCSNLTIGSGVTLKTTGYYAIDVDRISSSYKCGYGVNITVNGTIESQYGLYVSGNIAQSTGNVPVVNVSGATINSKYCGMYQAGYAKTTFENTDITLTTDNSTTESPVEIAAGEFTMNGGVFTGVTNDNTSASVGGSITTEGGSGIFIKQHSTMLPVIVNLNGGTISAGVAVNIQEDANRAPELVEVYINGGSYNSNATNEPAVKKGSSAATVAITGGTFSTDVTDYCAQAYGCYTMENGKYGVAHVQVPVINEGAEPEDETAKAAVEEAVTTENVTAVVDNVAEKADVPAEATSSYIKVALTETATTESAVTGMTFDVKPVYTDAEGEHEITTVNEAITFRLPVTADATATAALVKHYSISMGYYPVKGDATNGKYIEVASKEFSPFSYTLADASDVKGNVYAGSASVLEGKTLDEFNTIRETAPNAIMIVDEKVAELVQDQTNVIVEYAAGKSGNYYECPKFVLTDDKDFFTPVDFTAVSGSYTRTLYQNSNTCCFPFALDATTAGGKILTFAYYEPIEGATDGSAYAYFNNRSEINAGVPCLIYETANVDMNVTFSNTEIVAKPENSGNMQGAFVTTTYSGDMWGLNNDGTKLAKATSSDAFRAVLSLGFDEAFNGGSNHNAGAKPSTIEIGIIGDDGEATGIDGVVIKSAKQNDAIYTVEGVKVQNMNRPGIYIINGRKAIVK